MSIETIIEDWPTVKQRWAAWWQQAIHDRVVFWVTAPRDGAAPAASPNVDAVTQWTDVDFMVQRTLATVHSTWYGGDALPVFSHMWSAGHALVFGCTPHYATDTVWVDPAPVGPDGYPVFDGWQQSHWWPWIQNLLATAARASAGRYFVQPTFGNHAADNLALIRDPQTLMLDIATNPAWVKRAVKSVSDVLVQMFARFWQLTAPEVVGIEGSVSYIGPWSPARTMGFDCDISCMVSGKAFRDIFLPPLVETMRTVDHRIYHLDGWVALQHLDTLLDLPELHAIQWVPGAGRTAIMQWAPLIQRIQSKGKSIVVEATPDEVEPLLRAVQPEGLCIQTRCQTEAEGRDQLQRVARLTARAARVH